jgi:Na+/H+ antiporter NhaD/arsenite permease-like protein
MFSFGIFFFSNIRKKKKTKNKKTIEKKKNAKKGGNFHLLNSCYALSFFALTFTFSLLPFCFKRFLLASSSSQAKEKKKKKKKKQKCKEGKELTFKLSLGLLIFGSCFWPLVSALLFQALSPWHLFFFQVEENQKKKNVDKGRSLLLHLR